MSDAFFRDLRLPEPAHHLEVGSGSRADQTGPTMIACEAVALRSRDRGMPEEINRLVADAITDLLWTPSPDPDANLLAEGVPAGKIDCIGNIMIDSFEMRRARIASLARTSCSAPCRPP
jgi:UDP-N-acetylglucosamine 2-epimerase (non-hydrolysing)